MDMVVTRARVCLDTGEPVFLPLRMSCFVFSNLVVTVGMLTPGLGVCTFQLLFSFDDFSYLRMGLLRVYYPARVILFLKLRFEFLQKPQV